MRETKRGTIEDPATEPILQRVLRAEAQIPVPERCSAHDRYHDCGEHSVRSDRRSGSERRVSKYTAAPYSDHDSVRYALARIQTIATGTSPADTDAVIEALGAIYNYAGLARLALNRCTKD